jgi:hypothetical protein
VKLIQFIRHVSPYNSGETAGFEDDQADRLIALRAAVLAKDSASPASSVDLSKMTKAQLVDYAQTIGVALDATSKKEEMIAAITAAQAGDAQ